MRASSDELGCSRQSLLLQGGFFGSHACMLVQQNACACVSLLLRKLPGTPARRVHSRLDRKVQIHFNAASRTVYREPSTSALLSTEVNHATVVVRRMSLTDLDAVVQESERITRLLTASAEEVRRSALAVDGLVSAASLAQQRRQTEDNSKLRPAL